jgi:hypothetical protein
MRVPPELMSAEERVQRIEDIERRIPREWLRYAVTEAVVVFLPFLVVLGTWRQAMLSRTPR